MNKRRLGVAASIFSAFALTATITVAQPENPGPDAYVELGDLGIGQTLQQDVPLAPGEDVWFRFRLTTPITPQTSWLDVDTAGPSSLPNIGVAIYDAWSNLIAQDNNNGGGTSGDAAALSLGGGSGQKLSGNICCYGGGRISDGSWGSSLEAGVYYAVIGRDNTTFPNPNPNWETTSTVTGTAGTVRLRITTNSVPSSYWNERHHGVDAGMLPETAQVPNGEGPLTSIVTSFGGGGRDMFKIRICDPASFQVTATPTQGEPSAGGGVYRARLFLFDETGRGVVAINNTHVDSDTVLHAPPALAGGDYYLAVTSWCGGYFAGSPGEGGPLDASDQAIWTFQGNNNLSLLPNGAGAANPIAYWARQASCEGAINDAHEGYYVRLSLAGACHVGTSSCCPGDMNFDDLLDGEDIQVFVESLLSGSVCQ